ncbi:conserved hypothetical protein [Talaromyces stipitatus ATCC 10500]|uniref:Inner kinetochore subunit AME1 domain-containing protein n=1 Tax=Talaromyces stipitatus (strain ATCC 10500 / CBS 375.48 / QM 6759 / NRRL 1006) TaxID=441959 RepID=B8MGW9_TALSN|nr:uncharacterized protein TSTA_014410 [Talaromyces stipitatus ATCC 10500]EED16350.1 conserved hypothetical protein [Talaromyces stipitatus ATCC 10500]
MAASREERLQMRQRGAGTRKVQALDFGFSFGSPTESTQAPSVAQQLESVPEDTNVVESTTTTTLPSAIATVTEHSTRETPTRVLRNSTAAGSSRRLDRVSVGRVSTPNNTTEQEEGRSSKRRRISTRNDDSTLPATSQSEIVNLSLAIHEDTTQNDEQQNSVDNSAEVPEVPTADVRDDQPPGNTIVEDAPPQEIITTNRRGRPKTAESQENRKEKSRQKDNQTRRHSIRQEAGSSDPPEDTSNQETQPRLPRARSRRGAENQPAAEAEPEIDREAVQEDEAPEASTAKSGRKRKNQPENGQDKGKEPTQQAPRGRRKRTRPPIEDEAEDREDTAPQPRKERKGKNREVEAVAEMPGEETQERAEEIQKSKENGESSRRRGRPSLDKEQDSQPEAETTTTTRPEPDQAPKRRRGRASGVTSEDKPTRRREGTVAITVHRLANAHILDSTGAASDPSDNEQDSTDELEAVGKNFPSRNGVNAADVLSQICKEILDKHLTTLDNNIANDAGNQSKRSEYARQRKTIEAYGTQLEGRLFELSELLDSNFSLGVQLKKAKREAAEMRNRLLEIRQQRHEITLRMDAVRRRHIAEENAKMARNAINNTLHNLDLTLDRNRVRADDDRQNESSGIAGLEFLLRSVSENVSSAAEGSYGGLLQQAKAFNAQLEMTVRKLEGSTTV